MYIGFLISALIIGIIYVMYNNIIIRIAKLLMKVSTQNEENRLDYNTAAILYMKVADYRKYLSKKIRIAFAEHLDDVDWPDNSAGNLLRRTAALLRGY